MFPESKKQFSVQKNKEEKPKEVSPKLYQRAIEYAKRIKEIRKKETPTEEDLKEVKRLLKKIEIIFSPEELYFESKRAQQLLESLKNTPLYDKERKQWNEYMNKEQQLQEDVDPYSSRRYSSDQILGVIVEAVIGNIDEAQQLLEFLKNTPLYDKERKQWNWYMNKEQQLQEDVDPYSSSRSSSDQLLGVIAEAVIGNIDEAQQLLEFLKNTPLYDKERKQWNWHMNKEQQLQEDVDPYNSSRSSFNQLLGVIAEAVIGNIDEAQQLLESLKNTPLYDKERKQWNWYMDKEQQLPDSDSSRRRSSDQLLGVIVEAFDEKPEEFVRWFTKS
jgi:uncharacterized protein with von Willebrand factor type A (vWA) domain